MHIFMRPFRTRVSALQNSCHESKWQIDSFRWRYFEKQIPVRYKRKVFAKLNTIPAATTWIKPFPYSKKALKKVEGPAQYQLDYEHLEQYGDTIVPIERTIWGTSQDKQEEERKWDVKSFERFEAPLSLFLEWTKKKLAQPDTFSPNESLYIAQCSITSLPPDLRHELPAPVYCTHRTSEKDKAELKAEKVGRQTGVDPRLFPETENSSIWMGIPPTETPLHKDPNNNFIFQMAGKKTIRLMKPEDGELMLAWVKRQQGQMAMGMRGEEMMVGPERDIMRDLVWEADIGEHILAQLKTQFEKGRGQEAVVESEGAEDTENVNSEDAQVNRTTRESGKSSNELKAGKDKRRASSNFFTLDLPEFQSDVELSSKRIEVSPQASEKAAATDESDELPQLGIYEQTLMPGDALFIPQYWYHSVRSVGTHENGINVSANWWFRLPLRADRRGKNEKYKELTPAEGTGS
jgi:hypothetical protein